MSDLETLDEVITLLNDLLKRKLDEHIHISWLYDFRNELEAKREGLYLTQPDDPNTTYEQLAAHLTNEEKLVFVNDTKALRLFVAQKLKHKKRGAELGTGMARLQKERDAAHLSRAQQLETNTRVNNDMWNKIRQAFRDRGYNAEINAENIHVALRDIFKRAEMWNRLIGSDWDSYFAQLERSAKSVAETAAELRAELQKK